MRNDLIENLRQGLLMVWTDTMLQLPTRHCFCDFVFCAQSPNNLPHGIYIDW